MMRAIGAFMVGMSQLGLATGAGDAVQNSLRSALATGQSAVVTIKDRGPHVKGRIVDLSPSTARRIGLTPNERIAKVVVVPIAVPLSNGAVTPGQAANE